MSYAKRYRTEPRDNPFDTYANDMLMEADAEIAAVTAERDRAQKACEQMGARIAELEAALETCADISSQPGVVDTARVLLYSARRWGDGKNTRS